MQGRSWRRRLLDESGQDLIEYGLLAAIIAMAGVLLFPAIQAGMALAFDNWGDDVYDLWAPKEPGA
jgi:Flp pilus assembly pilin Flp